MCLGSGCVSWVRVYVSMQYVCMYVAVFSVCVCCMYVAVCSVCVCIQCMYVYAVCMQCVYLYAVCMYVIAVCSMQCVYALYCSILPIAYFTLSPCRNQNPGDQDKRKDDYGLWEDACVSTKW